MGRGRTGLSGETCSRGDILRLYPAQTISRDFFRVSSILQAVKRAAAAASYLHLADRASEIYSTPRETHSITVFIVGVHEPELVIVHHGRVKGADGSAIHSNVSHSPFTHLGRKQELTSIMPSAHYQSTSRPVIAVPPRAAD